MTLLRTIVRMKAQIQESKYDPPNLNEGRGFVVCQGFVVNRGFVVDRGFVPLIFLKDHEVFNALCVFVSFLCFFCPWLPGQANI